MVDEEEGRSFAGVAFHAVGIDSSYVPVDCCVVNQWVDGADYGVWAAVAESELLADLVEVFILKGLECASGDRLEEELLAHYVGLVWPLVVLRRNRVVDDGCSLGDIGPCLVQGGCDLCYGVVEALAVGGFELADPLARWCARFTAEDGSEWSVSCGDVHRCVVGPDYDWQVYILVLLMGLDKGGQHLGWGAVPFFDLSVG
jgi:hypothetical protein